MKKWGTQTKPYVFNFIDVLCLIHQRTAKKLCVLLALIPTTSIVFWNYVTESAVTDTLNSRVTYVKSCFPVKSLLLSLFWVQLARQCFWFLLAPHYSGHSSSPVRGNPQTITGTFVIVYVYWRNRDLNCERQILTLIALKLNTTEYWSICWEHQTSALSTALHIIKFIISQLVIWHLAFK